jgi:triosephosphate isomerase
MPSRYLIANWKMNLPTCGLDLYFQQLKAPPNSKVVVAPPFPYLKELRPRAALAGQNCADQPSGAFTGEVSAQMLRDCGAAFVIIGHSERRNIFGETDAMIARKLTLAIEAGLTPILCVGEAQKIRDAGQAAIFVANQIKSVAVEPLQSASEVLIAYEPVWAIGTGRNATGEMVAEMVAHIRDALGRFWPSRHVTSAPILYGGSVTPDNIADLCENGRVDGFLVGGASLDPLKFSVICKHAAKAAGS